MIIEIEYPVIVTGRPPRSTKDKTVVFLDRVKFDFPTYSKANVRSAVTYEDHKGERLVHCLGIDGALFTGLRIGAPSDGRLPFEFTLARKASVLTAHLESALLDLGRKMRDAHSTAVSTALYPGDLAELFSKGLTTNRTLIREQVTTVALRPLEELDLKDVDGAEIERQRLAFREHLSEFAVVGGVFVRTVPEPLYAVSIGFPTDGGGSGTAPAIRLIEPPRGKSLHRMIEHVNVAAFFSVDRLDDAIAYASKIKSAQDRGEWATNVGNRRATVKDATTLRFDDERESLLVVAEHMAVTFMDGVVTRRDKIQRSDVREGLERASVEAIVAWKALTSAMTSDDHDELPVAMRECLEIDAISGGGVFTPYAFPAAVIECAISKWEDREVRFDLAPPTAASSPRF